MSLHGGSLRCLLTLAAREDPSRTAVVTPSTRMTYAALAGRSAALASALKMVGIGPGVQVAFSLSNSPEFLVWYFGVLEVGGVIVPLPVDLRPAEVNERLAAGAISYLAVPSSAAWPGEISLAPVAGREAMEGCLLWRRDGAVARLEGCFDTPEGVLIRQFSSGSTGRPKQLLKTEANVADEIQHFCTTLRLGRDDVFLGVAPFCHAYGALSFLAAVQLRAILLALPRFLPGAVLRIATEHPPRVFLATPPMIRSLATCHLEPGDESAFRQLRLCICSTDLLDMATHAAFLRRYGIRVHVQYGSTETLSATIDLDDDFEEGRAGRPYAGVEVGIFDEQGSPRPPGHRGRIGIRSPAASTRYEDDPVSTSLTFQRGRVFPGDEGYLDALGRLHVLGRSDVLNIGGAKVDGLEVERIIRDALPVRAVIVVAGERNGLPVVRAIVEADPNQVTPFMVQEICRKQLSPYKVPAIVDVIARLPRDDNGKIRRALLDLGRQRS